MSVTLQQVENIARLSKLSFSDEEMGKFVEQFNQILGYMEKLNELDTTQVDPTDHILDLQNVFREDVTRTWLTQEEALANAPNARHGFFSVPKVIG